MKYLYLPNEYSQQRQTEKPVWIYPVIMAMEATYLRNCGHYVHWGRKEERNYDEVVTKPKGIEFLSLPIPDRKFTRAFDKRYQVYGNYKYHPATHMQVADGCWHGKCSFCIERGRPYVIRPMDVVVEEIVGCMEMGFREIFDDSGTFPDGEWMDRFCRTFAGNKEVKFGCNMRIGADVDFKMMKKAGFRMLLYGIESASQVTLDRINKGVNANEVVPTLKRASEAGLEPHIATMYGLPGEGEKEELETIRLVHYLLRKGYAKTAQSSVYTFNGKRGTDRGTKNKIYEVAWFPDFWLTKLRDIHNWEDVKYLFKAIRKGIIHD